MSLDTKNIDRSKRAPRIIRERIVKIFEEMGQSVAYCLRAAVMLGELPQKLNAMNSEVF